MIFNNNALNVYGKRDGFTRLVGSEDLPCLGNALKLINSPEVVFSFERNLTIALIFAFFESFLISASSTASADCTASTETEAIFISNWMNRAVADRKNEEIKRTEIEELPFES